MKKNIFAKKTYISGLNVNICNNIIKNPKVFKKNAVNHDGCTKYRRIFRMGLNNDGVPVFNNGIKANMADMQKFFNGNVSKENTAKLASIFAKCDTEGKVDKNGKQVGDGELKGEERNKFKDMVQKFLPEAVMDVAEFFIAVEMSEDRKK